MRDMVIDLVDNNLPVVLAKEEMNIYFTKTHLADLRVILRTDDANADGANGTDTENEGLYAGNNSNRTEHTKVAAPR
jgi:hypothetical protein